MGYFLFAPNTAKSCVEILICLGLTIAYEAVNSALELNADASLVKMRVVLDHMVPAASNQGLEDGSRSLLSAIKPERRKAIH